MKLLQSCSPNFLKFYDWSQKYLKEHNKTCRISNSKSIRHKSGKCAGWCDGNHIEVAFKNLLFEETYVHEFSHMQQAVENCQAWQDYDSSFWDDLEKKKITLDTWKSILSIISLEHDCESRSIQHSKKWKLFDNKQYARKANVYLYYYQYLFVRGKWITSTGIYKPYLIDLMKDKLVNLEELDRIDMSMMRIYDHLLFKKGC